MPFARCTTRAAERLILIRCHATIPFVPPNHARIQVSKEPVAILPPVLHCPGEIEVKVIGEGDWRLRGAETSHGGEEVWSLVTVPPLDSGRRRQQSVLR